MDEGRGARVLIVDDDPLVRSATARALRLRGYSIVEAKDGEEALARVAEQVPAAILLDLGLPDMDGHEVLQRWVAGEVGSGVVVVSAVLTNEVTAALLGGRVVACLAEPYSSTDLATAVERAVEAFEARAPR